MVAPGSVRTPIWAKSIKLDIFPDSSYARPLKNFINQALLSEKKGLLAKDIADLLAKIIATKKPCLRYDPVPQKLANYWLPKLLPAKLLDRL